MTRAGGVDDLVDRFGGNLGARAVGDTHGALGAARGDQHGDLALQHGEPCLEILFAGQRCEFAFIDEENIDLPFLDQRAEIVAMTKLSLAVKATLRPALRATSIARRIARRGSSGSHRYPSR